MKAYEHTPGGHCEHCGELDLDTAIMASQVNVLVAGYPDGGPEDSLVMRLGGQSYRTGAPVEVTFWFSTDGGIGIIDQLSSALVSIAIRRQDDDK